MKHNKKEISVLLKNVAEGNYNKAKSNVRSIVESKLGEKISIINSNLKTQR